MMAIILNFK